MQVQDTSVDLGVLVTWVLWGLVAGFTSAGWLVWAGGGSDVVAVLLGITAACFVGPATVAHIRLYAGRVAFVVRATAASAAPEGDVLRPVRS